MVGQNCHHRLVGDLCLSLYLCVRPADPLVTSHRGVMTSLGGAPAAGPAPVRPPSPPIGLIWGRASLMTPPVAGRPGYAEAWMSSGGRPADLTVQDPPSDRGCPGGPPRRRRRRARRPPDRTASMWCCAVVIVVLMCSLGVVFSQNYA